MDVVDKLLIGVIIGGIAVAGYGCSNIVRKNMDAIELTIQHCEKSGGKMIDTPKGYQCAKIEMIPLMEKK